MRYINTYLLLLFIIYSRTLCSSMYLFEVNSLFISWQRKFQSLNAIALVLPNTDFLSRKKKSFHHICWCHLDMEWCLSRTSSFYHAHSNITIFFVVTVHPSDLDCFQTLCWRRCFILGELHYAQRAGRVCLLLEVRCFVSSKTFLFLAFFPTPKTNKHRARVSLLVRPSAWKS